VDTKVFILTVVENSGI